jgi:hypothetical protein
MIVPFMVIVGTVGLGHRRPFGFFGTVGKIISRGSSCSVIQSNCRGGHKSWWLKVIHTCRSRDRQLVDVQSPRARPAVHIKHGQKPVGLDPRRADHHRDDHSDDARVDKMLLPRRQANPA